MDTSTDRSGTTDDPTAGVRHEFDAAAAAFEATVLAIGSHQWPQPGLGEWTVLELLAHTLRAFLTIEQGVPAPDAAPPDPTSVLPSAAAYYRAVLGSDPDIHAQVAERARAGVAALGDDPAATAVAVSQRVRALVATLPADGLLTSLAGPMPVAAYLESRLVELTTHTLDLQRATGHHVPLPAAAVRRVLHTLVEAADDDALAALHLALTGRAALPAGFNVLG